MTAQTREQVVRHTKAICDALEPVAEIGQHGFQWTQHGFNTDTPIGTLFYTSPPSTAEIEEVMQSHRRLVRELDVLLNGEEGAAKQASLCDIVAQVRRDGVGVQSALGAQAIKDVIAERQRQQSIEGWTPEHDDQYDDGDLAIAAACYANPKKHADPRVATPINWPWSANWWKPSADERRNLVKAGALILAEIERIDRATIASAKGGAA